MSPRHIVVVCGNPRPGSRTLRAAVLLADSIAGGADVDAVDLAEHAAQLLQWQGEAVLSLKRRVLAADALIVATPTYKGSFTGLIKQFLDQFDRDELAGRLTIPLMTGGSPDHSLAVEHHLRPVLIEIGASCPTRGVYLAGDQVDDPAEVLGRWQAESASVLRRHIGADWDVDSERQSRLD